MKKVLILLVGCLISFSTIAQQNLYKWNVGVHGGLGTYYGDLSTGRFLDPQTAVLRFWDNPKNLSYGVNIAYSMNNAWSFRLMSTYGSFQANDRATKWNGDPYLKSENYGRALNFRTDYNDVDGLFIYHFDNGKFFGEKSFFAPYIGIGLGYMNFRVKGDLYQADGNRYHYWSDNTIRDISENSPNAVNATIIEQDGVYETDLNTLLTEGKSYSTSTLTIPLAMGLKFRLNDRINLNLETLLHYAMTDYLDDVSGNYPLVFDTPEQLYASNPSSVVRDVRGTDNKMKDIYGSFNLSIGYNFGYKKQAFRAPVFYLGEADIVAPPVVKIEEKDSIIVNIIDDEEETTTTTTTTVTVETEGEITKNNLVTIIRDTVYEQGTLIHEKVIIRTDTVREIIKEYIKEDQSSILLTPLEETEIVAIPLTNDLDTVVMLDPITMQEDTVVYAGEIAIETVPEEPVFTLEVIETMDSDSIDEEFFFEEIGYLKDDLTEDEISISKIQESNFELIALRNEINELKIKDDKSQEEIDALYLKMDELAFEQKRMEEYNEKNPSSNIELQQAADDLAEDLAEVRTEIIYLEAPASSNSQVDYERIRKENNERFSSLEKEMRKMRKDIRKSKRTDLPPRVHNPSRSEEKEVEVVIPSTSNALPAPIIIDNTDNAANLEYQLQIAALQKELSEQKLKNEQKSSAKEAEVVELKKQLALLELQMKASQTTGNSDSKTLEYISSLEGKLNQLNTQLANTQKDIAALKSRPIPKSTTTVISQPITRPTSTISVTSASRDAISRLGKINIYYNTGKSNIKTEFYNDLNRVVSTMQQFPEINANLTGFTDKSGNPDANFRLSKKRSDAVANYLISRGISPQRISTNYYGDTQSSSNNDPFSRRVEILLNSY